jgi:hypothetical protein
MSHSIYVAFDREVESIATYDFTLLNAMIADREAMDALSRKLGVASLSKFESQDPREALSQLIEDPAKLEAAVAKSPPVKYFNPADALISVSALVAHYASTPYVVQSRKGGPKDETKTLMSELGQLQTVLLQAQKVGARFRLFVDL